MTTSVASFIETLRGSRLLETVGDKQIYVREYVEGTDLARLVADHGPLPESYASDYVHQTAQGLQQAHERGLAHGHVQPSNLIVAGGAALVAATNNDGASGT